MEESSTEVEDAPQRVLRDAESESGGSRELEVAEDVEEEEEESEEAEDILEEEEEEDEVKVGEATVDMLAERIEANSESWFSESDGSEEEERTTLTCVDREDKVPQ